MARKVAEGTTTGRTIVDEDGITELLGPIKAEPELAEELRELAAAAPPPKKGLRSRLFGA